MSQLKKGILKSKKIVMKPVGRSKLASGLVKHGRAPSKDLAVLASVLLFGFLHGFIAGSVIGHIYD
ncbi:MAG: hypothetical protein LBU36_03315 [Clostridiales bacterium]|nr:hypothetical protein [Clostridiales bacterium]